MRRTMLVLVCALLAFPAIAQTTLNGAGATFPYPMYSKWFSEYHKLHPDIQINYQSIGSGGGIRQVINGTVDFG
ncbi:MAG: substrate-binding domain-containing protein, partial [Candidatus Sulfotelmatobacter sp.]